MKLPRLLENFSELSPVQIAGGEQTLFALTTDGKARIYIQLYICIQSSKFTKFMHACCHF